MSRSFWRCETADCRTILGTIRRSGSLYLDPAVEETHTDLRAGRAQIVCPSCGTARVYRSGTVHRVPGDVAAGEASEDPARAA